MTDYIESCLCYQCQTRVGLTDNAGTCPLCGSSYRLEGNRLVRTPPPEPVVRPWGAFEWCMFFTAAGGLGLLLMVWLWLGCAQ